MSLSASRFSSSFYTSSCSTDLASPLTDSSPPAAARLPAALLPVPPSLTLAPSPAALIMLPRSVAFSHLSILIRQAAPQRPHFPRQLFSTAPLRYLSPIPCSCARLCTSLQSAPPFSRPFSSHRHPSPSLLTLATLLCLYAAALDFAVLAPVSLAINSLTFPLLILSGTKPQDLALSPPSPPPSSLDSPHHGPSPSYPCDAAPQFPQLSLMLRPVGYCPSNRFAFIKANDPPAA